DVDNTDAVGKVEVYTIRTEKINGVYYIVLISEHAIVISITTFEYKANVKDYHNEVSIK
ncbi:hypothetical protein, partial [Staphylococcus aureus]